MMSRSARIYDFVLGVTRSGKIMCKRYTIITNPDALGYGLYSDHPLWEFDIPTLGL